MSSSPWCIPPCIRRALHPGGRDVMFNPGATRWWLALSIAVVVSAGAGAQQQPVLRLTLEDAQARALQNSHRVAEVRARASVADAPSAG